MPPQGAASVTVELACSTASTSQSGSHTQPANFPVTSIQAPNLPPDTRCSVDVISTPADSKECKSKTSFKMPDLPSITPGLSNFSPDYATNISATVTVVAPGEGCKVTNYIVSAVPTITGVPTLTGIADAKSLQASLSGFVPGVSYNLQVVGTCPDGSSTPTGDAHLTVTPPCPPGGFQTNGYCKPV